MSKKKHKVEVNQADLEAMAALSNEGMDVGEVAPVEPPEADLDTAARIAVAAEEPEIPVEPPKTEWRVAAARALEMSGDLETANLIRSNEINETVKDRAKVALVAIGQVSLAGTVS